MIRFDTKDCPDCPPDYYGDRPDCGTCDNTRQVHTRAGAAAYEQYRAKLRAVPGLWVRTTDLKPGDQVRWHDGWATVAEVGPVETIETPHHTEFVRVGLVGYRGRHAAWAHLEWLRPVPADVQSRIAEEMADMPGVAA